jgi:hypothetical protein
MLLAQHPSPRRRNTSELRKKFLRETENFLASALRQRGPTPRYLPKPRRRWLRLPGDR